jgi:hypothetical protein
MIGCENHNESPFDLRLWARLPARKEDGDFFKPPERPGRLCQPRLARPRSLKGSLARAGHPGKEIADKVRKRSGHFSSSGLNRLLARSMIYRKLRRNFHIFLCGCDIAMQHKRRNLNEATPRMGETGGGEISNL